MNKLRTLENKLTRCIKELDATRCNHRASELESLIEDLQCEILQERHTNPQVDPLARAIAKLPLPKSSYR